MQIVERRIGQSIILDLTGELSYANRTTFKAAVERSKRAGCRHLILNMQGVRFLDSSALGTLALLAQEFSGHARHGQPAEPPELCQRNHHPGKSPPPDPAQFIIWNRMPLPGAVFRRPDNSGIRSNRRG